MTEMDKKDDQALAAEYALGLLSRDQVVAFEERMARDPSLRDRYAAWSEDFAQLAEALPDETSPPGLFDKIEDRVFPLHRHRFGAFRSLRFLLGMAAAASAILFFVGFYTPPAPPGLPAYTATLQAEDSDLRIDAALDETAGEMLVQVAGLNLPQDRVLEVWLISGDNAPVSLGVLPHKLGSAILPVSTRLASLFAGGAIAVSDEPLGGSPTGAPTGAVLAAGAITEL